MKSNKKIIIALSIIVTSLVLIAMGRTLAYFTSKDTVVNRFDTGDIKANIQEPGFIPKDDWDGQSYDKVVEIKNTGKNKNFIRVSITPRWVDENDTPWAGDVSDKVVFLEFQNLIDIPSDNTWTPNKWVKGSDEFYYYTSILDVDKTTEKLLKSVKANITKAEVDYPEDYEGKYLKIDVKVEAVQTTIDAYKTVWSVPNNIKPLLEELSKNKF